MGRRSGSDTRGGCSSTRRLRRLSRVRAQLAAGASFGGRSLRQTDTLPHSDRDSLPDQGALQHPTEAPICRAADGACPIHPNPRNQRDSRPIIAAPAPGHRPCGVVSTNSRGRPPPDWAQQIESLESPTRASEKSRRRHRRGRRGLHRPRLPPGGLRRGRVPRGRDHLADDRRRRRRSPRCGACRRSIGSLEEMLDDPAIEVVDVAVPPDRAAGRDPTGCSAHPRRVRGILAQKPLAMSYARGRAAGRGVRAGRRACFRSTRTCGMITRCGP